MRWSLCPSERAEGSPPQQLMCSLEAALGHAAHGSLS